MFPTLADRDTVLLEPPSRIAVGDIVLVDHGGSPLLHRVVQMEGEQILTRGDARMTPDASLFRRDIIARAVRARRGNREWSLTPGPWRRLRMRVSLARGGRMAVANWGVPV